MRFETFEEIMSYAIQKEKEAAAFYKELSKQEKSIGAQETFIDFAKEEQRHKEMLENFTRANAAGNRLETIPNLKRSDYIVEMTYEKNMAYHEILMLAMKREEKALKLYNSLLDNTDNADQKKIFKVLCQEEAKHKLALETMYDDYMAKMGD